MAAKKDENAVSSHMTTRRAGKNTNYVVLTIMDGHKKGEREEFVSRALSSSFRQSVRHENIWPAVLESG